METPIIPIVLYAESTPNPATMKFVANKMLIEDGATAQYLEGLAQIVPAEKPQLLAEEIMYMKLNQTHRSLLAAKALAYARLNLTRENGRQRYIDWVLGVTRK